jgi:hypothetical protein
MDWFVHPSRAKENVDGPFYAVAIGCDCGCMLPESIAPDLLGTLGRPSYQTYFRRQPETPDEIDRACEAIEICPIHDLRYGGKDPAILKRLPESQCDFRLLEDGRVELCPPSVG